MPVKPPSPKQLTRAEARFRTLIYELKLLLLAFPHLNEAIDTEDLPIGYLLKEGAAHAKPVRATRKRRARK